MHLFYPPADLSLPSTSNASQIHLICAYEDGGVTLRRYTQTDRLKSVQGAGWEAIWRVKHHTETSTLFPMLKFMRVMPPIVMAMRVSKSNSFALTVSADHIVGCYDLTVMTEWNDYGLV
jgi:hypothetical protein